MSAAPVMDELLFVVPDGLDHQDDFWFDTTNNRELAMIGPLGTGKTMALSFKLALLSAANAPYATALVVPSFAMFDKIHRREWPVLLGESGVTVQIGSAQNPVISWPWGAVSYVYSGERPETIVGTNLAAAVGDEPALWERETYERITARIRHPGASVRQLALAGTPEGVPSWFADEFNIWETIENKATGWSKRTIRARGWHPSMRHYIARLRQTYGANPALFATYARGEFVPLRTGLAYALFRPERDVHAATVYTAHADLWLACDFNIDAMRWLLMQDVGGDLRVIDEIAPGPNTPVQEAAAEVVRRYALKVGEEHQHQGSLIVTGDAAGRARTHTGQVSYSVLVECLRPHFRSVTLRVANQNPRVQDRVGTVNAAFAAGRVRVNPRCRELVRDLSSVTWKQGVAEIDKSDRTLTHASDALGYGVVAMHGLTTIRASVATPRVPRNAIVEESF